ALKRQDYGRAIAIFEELSQANIPKAYQLKAQMGLVRTYEAQQQWQQALAVCQPLIQSSSSQVRDWANTKQHELTQAQQAPTSDLSGFQPLDTGFQPLEVAQPSEVDHVPSPSANIDASLAEIAYPSAAESNYSSPVADNPNQDLTDTTPSAEPLPPQDIADNTSAPSLFHYESLNQSLNVSASTTSDTTTSAPTTSAPTTFPAPTDSSATTTSPASTETEKPKETEQSTALTPTRWRYAERLKTGRSLGKVKQGRLWLAQGLTALLTFGLLRFLLNLSLRSFNSYLRMLDRILPLDIRPIRAFEQNQTWPLLIVLLGLGIAAPWLWDWLLRLTADMRPFSTRVMIKSSPEAVKVLRQACLKRNWQFPTLGLLPTEIPLIFSYGWLPRYGRLMVSQGLLDQLEDDEIATLVAYEMSHWRRWDWPLVSLQGLLLYGFHWLYWRLALWGNRQPPMVKFAAGLGANLSYGVFWLVQKAGSWLSRLRTYYCDRAAAETTGNPNGLVRALGKLTLALNHTLETQGYTPPFVERLTLLLPTHAAASPMPTAALPQHFTWDILNPFRSWLSCNQSHPPLGDRLQLLTMYARYWKLPPEIDFQPLIDRYAPNKSQKGNALSLSEWKTLLLQGGPWFGLALGGLIGLLLWGIGAAAATFQWAFVDWLYKDPSVLKSALLLGLGTGILLRINALFPDLDPNLEPTDTQIADWAIAPDLIPVDSLRVKLSGQLLGRPGIANWLGQELLLKTPQGLFKLHFFSLLGTIGNGLKLGPRPVQDLNQPAQILGWFRRGQQIWIDIDQIKTTNQIIQAQHPLWSAAILAISFMGGLWILARG
ncbi:MAG: M48 family metalloprotease, partial [Cyanobacteria bacterium P01_D01_bin.44]